MAVLGLAPDVIKPAAMALNVLVASIACWRFRRAGLLTWHTCYPFAILGAPFSLLPCSSSPRGKCWCRPVVLPTT